MGCGCVYLYLYICNLRHYKNEDQTTNSQTNNEMTSDMDIFFKRTWPKPSAQTQPSKEDCKLAHMQNGPGKILDTTLSTYPAKYQNTTGLEGGGEEEATDGGNFTVPLL